MHAIIAIRNFIDYNYTMRNNFKDLLINSLRFTYSSCFIKKASNNFNDGFSDDDFIEFTQPLNESFYNLDFDVKLDSLLYYKDIYN